MSDNPEQVPDETVPPEPVPEIPPVPEPPPELPVAAAGDAEPVLGMLVRFEAGNVSDFIGFIKQWVEWRLRQPSPSTVDSGLTKIGGGAIVF